MKYCSQCRADIQITVPEGDNRERYTCPQCQHVFYENPNIITGTIPLFGDKVMLAKRSIEPRFGLWTLPAGFMENAETTLQGAWRETQEETQAQVEIQDLFCICNVPHINQVHMFYLAKMFNEDFGPTSESSEVALFSEAEIPWDQIAFATVSQTLKHFFHDHKQGQFQLHHVVI